MSAPFQPGDRVEVIDDTPAAWHEPQDHTLHLGDVFAVRKFVRAFPFGWGFPRSFVEIAATKGAVSHWDAYRFRKIDDEQIPEVLERIKSLKTPETADA